jgi:hypothetical protein
MMWEAVMKFAKSLSCVLRQAKSAWKLATHSNILAIKNVAKPPLTRVRHTYDADKEQPVVSKEPRRLIVTLCLQHLDMGEESGLVRESDFG